MTNVLPLLIIMAWYAIGDIYWASIQLGLLIFSPLYLAIFIQNIGFIVRLALFCGFIKIIIGIKAAKN